ncbi:MAG: hypothetical protein AMXMBFR23_07070 [Chloroflexota bacterium]
MTRVVLAGGGASKLEVAWNAGRRALTPRGSLALLGAAASTGRLEASGVNLVRNPRAGISGSWSPSGTGTVIDPVELASPEAASAFTLYGHSGTTCRMSDSVAGTSPSLVQGAPFSARAWYRALNEEAVGSTFSLLLWEMGGAHGDETTVSATGTFTEEWQVATMSGAIQREGRTDLRVFAGTTVGGAAAGAEYALTAIQVEAAASLSSYIDGDLGAGYAWTGTPHASASTRAAGSLRGRVPAASAAAGGIALWLRPMWPGSAVTPRTVLDWRGASDRRLRLRHEDGEWRVGWRSGETLDEAVVTAGHATDGAVRLFAWWTPREVGLEVDGVAAGTPRTGAPPAMADALVSLGADLEGGAHADVAAGPWVWAGRPLRAVDRAVLARTPDPLRWRP